MSNLTTASLAELAPVPATAPNRAHSPILPPGLDDREAVGRWLASKRVGSGRRSPTTLSQYEGEALRLFWYCDAVSRPLSQWTQDDAVAYLGFLSTPPAWACRAPGRVRRDSPAWRPFVDPSLSDTQPKRPAPRHPGLAGDSLRQAQSIVTALFSWLVQVGHLRANPFAGIPLSKPHEASMGAVAQGRFLTERECDLLRQAIAARAVRTDNARRRQARDLFLIELCLRTGVRTSEALQAKMSDITLMTVPAELRLDRPDLPPAVWLLRVKHGKGGKARHVPCEGILPSLQAYRLAYELSPLPTPGDTRALLMSTRKATPQLALEHPLSDAELRQERERLAHYPPLGSRRAVYDIIQGITEEAAAYAACHEVPGVDLDRVRAASTHWLRHSYGKTMARQTSSLNAARNLGHADARTTEKHYLDDEVVRRALESEGRL